MAVINMEEHHFWGDNVYFLKAEDEHGNRRAINRVVGWMTPMPKVGDELICPLRSGKTGRFRIVKVEPQKDPADMFFATVDFVGYKED